MTQAVPGIAGVTSGPAALVGLAQGGPFRYGHGFVIQVAPRRAALICNVRNEDVPVGDFEAGMDAVVFGELADIAAAAAVPLTRNEFTGQAGQVGARVAIRYPIVPAFIPLGVLRQDGTPHPHAGSGFGVNEVLDFPLQADGSYDKRDKVTRMVRRTEVRQLGFDGSRLAVTETIEYDVGTSLKAPYSEWAMIAAGLGPGLADGDDLLFPTFATAGNPATWWDDPMACGVSRWSRRGGTWQPETFVPIEVSRYAAEPRVVYDKPMPVMSAEPSLIRDLDDSLLFTARGAGDEIDDHIFRVWRSTDGAESWDLILELPQGRGQAPVTINQAADGSPYLAATALGHERGWLCLWPLNGERNGLGERLTVRDGEREFGAAPSGKPWYIDHASGGRLQLADGRWHGVLTYRVMDTGEFSMGASAPQTGLYVEEVISRGPEVAAWRFAEA